ncbi:MAG: DUF2628 domain-containing protein [Ruminococcus sp.]|nr:DUF2628 domain-containing protein [Ruminococcus sp.]
MSKYVGSTCIVCGKRFTEDDDIVVCPECGTPYHRECYNEKGSCVNTPLHEKGVEWISDAPKPEVKAYSAEPGVKRCIRCGAENPPEERYCKECGTPLINMDTPRPFEGTENAEQQDVGTRFNPVMLNQDSDIDGVKLGDYARYVGSNPIGFLPSFISFAKAGRVASLNIFAMIFAPFYFMYRKMYSWGIFAIIVSCLLSVPTTIEMMQSTSGAYSMNIDLGIDVESKSFIALEQAVTFLMLGLKLASGIFANYLYYKKAKRDILKIRENSGEKSNEEVNMEIITTGGSSWGYALLGIMLAGAVNMMIIMLLTVLR